MVTGWASRRPLRNGVHPQIAINIQHGFFLFRKIAIDTPTTGQLFFLRNPRLHCGSGCSHQHTILEYRTNATRQSDLLCVYSTTPLSSRATNQIAGSQHAQRTRQNKASSSPVRPSLPPPSTLHLFISSPLHLFISSPLHLLLIHVL